MFWNKKKKEEPPVDLSKYVPPCELGQGCILSFMMGKGIPLGYEDAPIAAISYCGEDCKLRTVAKSGDSYTCPKDIEITFGF